ncbi:hypothetical protein OG244_13765 [Streptomyces brevispora]|uniref:hypothetical protein n=1 Tax=Streptomyces brevispora TaxID=887462 RepID=UPI002E339459|nr:hypothetical protein [Streptomyces brevispora]
MASAFDAQRGKLPVAGNYRRSPGIVAVARQISELGELITDLPARRHPPSGRRLTSSPC